MKKILSMFILVFTIISCDDGEIIVTSFDLENSELSLCSLGNQKVLYVTNNEGVHESMSLQLPDRDFDEDEQLLSRNAGERLEIELTGNSRMIYRIYDGEISNDYFCQAIPPREPRVVDEYVTTEGTVVISTQYNDIAAEGDADGDGILNADEGMDSGQAANPISEAHQDTDGDGIPDFLDIDDDGDNVPTRTETLVNDDDPTEEGYPDTDNDEIPNYLDPDDDGDGALTRFEVSSDDLLNPQTLQIADVPNYLNDELTEPYNEHDLVIDHSITRNYRSDIQIENFNFVRQDGSGEEIRFDVYNLGTYRVTGVEDDLEDLGEEEEEEEDNEEDS